MSLIWFDGFESYYNHTDMNALEGLYSPSASFGSSYGRRGSRGLRFDYTDRYFIKNIENTTTVIVGIALYRVSTTTGQTFFRLQESGTTHIYCKLNSSKVIEVYRGDNTLLGTTSGHTIETDAWYYFEIKATIDNSAGVVIIKMNEVEVLNSTGLDTQNTANAYVDRVIFEDLNVNHYDDFYICNSQGSKNNDFLGDVRVDVLRSDGAGSHTDFTPSAGSNYENVDETYPDDDSTYNDGSNIGDQDSYSIDDLPTPPSGSIIHGVKDQITVRKTDAGSVNCRVLTVQNSSDYLGPNINVSDSFTTHARVMEDNPDDDDTWADADINSSEVGVEITNPATTTTTT